MSHFNLRVSLSRTAARGLRAFALATLACVTASACADLDGAPDETLASSEQALGSALAIDFSSYALGPLGSPWTVTAGGGTSSVVSTPDQGHALRVAHGAERDYSFSQLALTNTNDTLEFEFKVKPKSSASAFTASVTGAKSGYKSTKFSLSLSPNSNLLSVTSIGANGGCGALPYGKWSSVKWKLRADAAGSTRRVVDVWVNGVLATTCTGVSTSLRVGTSLIISDNIQPSANAETLFDDFYAQAGAAP
jgi:hypothetical protein